MSSNLVTDKIRNMFDLSRWKDSDQFFLCPKLVKKQITTFFRIHHTRLYRHSLCLLVRNVYMGTDPSQASPLQLQTCSQPTINLILYQVKMMSHSFFIVCTQTINYKKIRSHYFIEYCLCGKVMALPFQQLIQSIQSWSKYDKRVEQIASTFLIKRQKRSYKTQR